MSAQVPSPSVHLAFLLWVLPRAWNLAFFIVLSLFSTFALSSNTFRASNIIVVSQTNKSIPQISHPFTFAGTYAACWTHYIAEFYPMEIQYFLSCIFPNQFSFTLCTTAKGKKNPEVIFNSFSSFTLKMINSC